MNEDCGCEHDNRDRCSGIDTTACKYPSVTAHNVKLLEAAKAARDFLSTQYATPLWHQLNDAIENK